MAVWDCFIFYNELDLLERRLHYLDSVVDHFVIVESSVTHKGTPKPSFYQDNKERYARWAHKIRHVVVDDNPSPGDTSDDSVWRRENHHRQGMLRALADAQSSDWVLVSDVDEIPNRGAVSHQKQIAAANPTAFHMLAFQYNLKWMQTKEPWFGTVMCQMDQMPRGGPQEMRDNRWKYPHHPYSGWHLSSFGDAHHVLNKVKEYAHCNDQTATQSTAESLEREISEGIMTGGAWKLDPTPAEVMRLIPHSLSAPLPLETEESQTA
jgi:beta-1,4-mannosyl-glycoprotein beta-1,4-N-acetylglucosaminyltransferase